MPDTDTMHVALAGGAHPRFGARLALVFVLPRFHPHGALGGTEPVDAHVGARAVFAAGPVRVHLRSVGALFAGAIRAERQRSSRRAIHAQARGGVQSTTLAGSARRGRARLAH